MKRLIPPAILVFFLLPCGSLLGQEQKVWFDYSARHRFNTETQYSTTLEINKSLNNREWTEYSLQNSLSHYLAGWISVHGSLDLFYTRDPVLDNVFEIRPWLKSTFYWQTYAKYLNLYFPYLGVRLEQRFLHYTGRDGMESKSRLRVALGTKFTINNDIIDDDTWWANLRAELFFNIDEAAVERYADQNRLMVGIGYNLNRDIRGEINYIIQNSENTIGSTDADTVHILQFMLTQYF